jgi:hypothetical protein
MFGQIRYPLQQPRTEDFRTRTNPLDLPEEPSYQYVRKLFWFR